ncbi:MAG: hypothetical protein ACD_49C00029G0001, partial [uncultured bacterium (gcode 4)]
WVKKGFLVALEMTVSVVSFKMTGEKFNTNNFKVY